MSMTRVQPFARANALKARIAEIYATKSGLALQTALAALPAYQSRSRRRQSRPGKAYQARSKYMPHQGVQEMLRREIGGWSKAYTTKREFMLAERG